MAFSVGESTWVGPVIAILCVVGVVGTSLWVFSDCLRYVSACCRVCCRVLCYSDEMCFKPFKVSSWNRHTNPIWVVNVKDEPS